MSVIQNNNAEKYFIKGYKPGMVVRVGMKNFLTYDEAEVFPGPRLNIVLGPNGTGKSTLTHAICLACGGSPATVGRSPNLSQFVKRGKEGQEAYTEVDLLHSKGIYSIRRTITSENKTSKWYINRAHSTQAAVLDIMKELKIDMDNLCSFMPQDKVGNFTQQTPQGVLQKTLQCVLLNNNNGKKTTNEEHKQGDDEPIQQTPKRRVPIDNNNNINGKGVVRVQLDKTLAQEQDELANVESQKNADDREMQAKEAAVTTLTNQVNSMRAEVDRMHARDSKKEVLECCQVKLKVLIAEEAAFKQKQCQDAVDESTRNYVTAKNTLGPLETKERELRMQQTLREKETNKVALKLSDTQAVLKKTKAVLEDLDVDLEKNSADLESIDKERKKKQTLLNTIKTNIQRLQSDLAAASERVPDSKKRIEAIQLEIIAKEEQKTRLVEELNELRNSDRVDADRLTQITHEIANLKDPATIFKNKLQARASVGKDNTRDVLSCMEYLQREQATLLRDGRLRKPIVGPVGMHCNVEDDACAAFFEKLGSHIYQVFLCETDADLRYMTQLRNQRGWKLDLYLIEHFEERQKYPPAFIDHLRKTNHVQGLLIDQMNCPDIVRAYLCSFHNMGSVLWAKGNNICFKNMNDFCYNNMGFHLFLQNYNTSTNKYELSDYYGTKSRYNISGPVSTRTSSFQGQKAPILGKLGGEEGGRKEGLEAQKQEIMTKRATCAHQQKLMMDASRKLGDNINALKESRNQLRALVNAPGTIKLKLDLELTKEKDMLKKLSSNVEEERKDLLAEYQKLVKKTLTLLQDSVTQTKLAISLQVEKDISEVNKKTLVNALYQASQAVRDGKQAVDDYARAGEVAKRQRIEAERRANIAIEELSKLESEKGGPERFSAYYVRVAELCKEATVDAIEVRIEELEIELNGIVENRDILLRFDRSLKELTTLTKELEVLRNRQLNAAETLEARMNKWTLEVEVVANRLNKDFKEYMSALQYKGEVFFNRVGSIKEYELHMKVSFRENSDVTILSGQKHSGGERAVSTIMFLMALQGMTTAPFRIVDEVNQGMDERNERLVFDRIVQSCCGPLAKSQYFLISPKLLQGLRSMENDDVTVLMIWNGPGVMTKWQLPEVINALKRKRGIALDDPFARHASTTTARTAAKATATPAAAATAANVELDDSDYEEEKQQKKHVKMEAQKSSSRPVKNER